MKRRLLLPISIALCLAAALSSFALAGRGPVFSGKNGGKPKVKIAAEFADFPLPYAATRVPANRQRAAKGWTEYLAFAFTAKSLNVFYQNNMPGHGWKPGRSKGSIRYWQRGRRTVAVVFVQFGPFCLIQVREYKR